MKKRIRIFGPLKFFFNLIVPLGIIFFLHIYKPDTHWSVYLGFGLSVVGMIILIFILRKYKKEADKRMNSRRDIIVKQEEGSDQHISQEDFIAVKRKVFLYDRFMFMLPLIITYFCSLYIENAAHSVALTMGAIVISLFIGALCGYADIKQEVLRTWLKKTRKKAEK